MHHAIKEELLQELIDKLKDAFKADLALRTSLS